MSLLDARKQLKKKKPIFFMQDAHKKKRLKMRWRRPKGSDSKIRVQRLGYRRHVEIGWGSPKEVKHLHPSGLRQIKVFSVAELDKINPKIDGALIAASVGTKKRVAIVTKAMEKGIMVLNVKNPKQYLEETAKRIEEKAAEKKTLGKEKEKKEKEKKATAEKKEEEKKKEEPRDELAEKLEEEEKKKKEKEEKDKVLIKKE